MSGLFSGLNIALQALLSNQQAIQVVEHNVSNVNTPGYKRQEAVLIAAPPYTVPTLRGLVIPGQMGTGVLVDRIRQFNLEFFDGRYRNELAETKHWELKGNVLTQVEFTLAETSDDGILPKLDAFWSGWQALSNDPTNMSLRADLRERASILTKALNTRAESLRSIQSDQNLALIQRVAEINSDATQIARLNTEILKVKSAGGEPNDLMDQRGELLNRLAEISGAVTNIQDDGEAIVAIGGHSLVIGSSTFGLSTEPDTTNNNLTRIYWTADNRDLNTPSGELAGLLEARDQIIPEQMAGLDELAQTLVTQVNALHVAGYGLTPTARNNNFFNPTMTSALSIRLSSDIDDLANIAAASNPDAPGDGNNALAIGNLQDSLLMNSNTSTINQFYTMQIANLGLQLQTANTRAKDRNDIVNSLNTLQESVSGVNLDEEAANLVKFQRAYQAATRMVTVIDEMLDKIINGMGVTR